MVDIRRGSPTFGQWEAFDLTEENMRSVYCPIGFAHGFCVLSDVADVMYKQSNYYSDATERGIAYNDPDVAIDWPLSVEELIPSKRDASAPLLRDIESELPFVYASSDATLQPARFVAIHQKKRSSPHRFLIGCVLRSSNGCWPSRRAVAIGSSSGGSRRHSTATTSRTSPLTPGTARRSGRRASTPSMTRIAGTNSR